MASQSLQFITSLTVCPSDIRKVRSALANSGSPNDPLQNVLTTPLAMGADSMKLVRDLAESGKKITFDSGAYSVQTGKMRYADLYMPLLDFYRRNRWADLFVLPDHVPTSQDSRNVVAQKVLDTITYGSLFYNEMPDEIKPRAMGVVQGTTIADADRCLETYLSLGIKNIGFGSFGTVGASSEVNVATNGAVAIAQYVARIAHEHGARVHAFGLGVPALTALLKGIGIDTFDSASWLKSAGFGQVFLPFMRSYNISYKSAKSTIQKGITFEQFQEWKELTGHSCLYCDSLVDLQKHKMHRAVHNLLVMKETEHAINHGDAERIRAIYAQGSARYRNEYDRWLIQN